MNRRYRKIVIDISPASDLDRGRIDREIATYPEEEKIVWHLCYGSPLPHPGDVIRMAPVSTAVRIFNERVALPYLARTEAVCLYEGSLSACVCTRFTEEEERADVYARYPAFPDSEGLRLVLLASETLHLLAALLPEELSLVAVFDGNDLLLRSPAWRATLLSKELFPYVRPRVVGSFPVAERAKVGIVIPSCLVCSEKSLALLDELFRRFASAEVPYRILPEVRLNEHWDGLDTIVFLSDFVSESGIRQARGFAAAGGRILYEGSPMGISGEMAYG
ncbi:MAG: hypothetical protein OXF02_03630 [Simkaniaceae bacterium]|nr:hypothetical protein [Simkaniaceae bacterium]